MAEPQVIQELKRDVFGRVELLDGPRGQAVRRVACGSRVPGSAWLARALLRRERRALEWVGGIRGVAGLLEWPDYAAAPSHGGQATGMGSESVLLRTWIPGVPLYRADWLPEDFFERLEELVGELHRCGVCHNDLHKEGNVLVDEGGYPALVDFQLASVHRRPGRTFRVRTAEDLRHVAKHRLVYARGTGRETGIDETLARDRVRRRSMIAWTWRRFGKPVYNFVTRRLLSYRDGEPRRPATGPWPRWTPPLGPRLSDKGRAG